MAIAIWIVRMSDWEYIWVDIVGHSNLVINKLFLTKLSHKIIIYSHDIQIR